MGDAPKLTKSQLKEQQCMLQKIADQKTIAKRDSNGVPHKYIKKATQSLRELYAKPQFHNNQKFLLARYSQLERKNVIWLNFFLPLYLGLFPTLYIKIYSLFVATANELKGLSQEISPASIGAFIVFWLCVVFLIGTIIFAIISLIGTIRTIVKALTKNPVSIIEQNELLIVESILAEHGILLK